MVYSYLQNYENMAYKQKISPKNLSVKDNVLLLQHPFGGQNRQTMKATIIQTDTVWGKLSENQQNAEMMLRKAPQSDVYILPEMWSTGFTMTPQTMAEDEAYSLKYCSLAWMKNMAACLNAAICGSLAIKTDSGEYRNRLYFVRPDGKIDTYDKGHLFFGAGEARHYKAGNCRCVAEFRGIRFLLTVCYDLRFPIWCRNVDDYDVMVCTANWPLSRERAWLTLLTARAIENQAFVIGANRCGADDICQYGGASAIISPYGTVMAQAGNKPETITQELDIRDLQRFREKFPVLKDRDKEMTFFEKA